MQLLAFKHPKNVVFPFAVEEATRRKLDVSALDLAITPTEPKPRTTEGLEQWNWAAFLLGPLWTLENTLDMKWVAMSWIFPFNIFAMIYLGKKGNTLAFEKSDLTDIHAFLTLQNLRLQHWIRVLFIAFVLSVVFELLAHILS